MATSIKELPPNLTFRVPYHASVTEKEMRRVAELLVDYEQRAAETRKQHARAFVAALEQRRKKLRSLLGAEHHFALQQFKGGAAIRGNQAATTSSRFRDESSRTGTQSDPPRY